MPNHKQVDQSKFVQERLYIELDYYVDPKWQEKMPKEEDDNTNRGVTIIEIL